MTVSVTSRSVEPAPAHTWALRCATSRGTGAAGGMSGEASGGEGVLGCLGGPVSPPGPHCGRGESVRGGREEDVVLGVDVGAGLGAKARQTLEAGTALVFQPAGAWGPSLKEPNSASRLNEQDLGSCLETSEGRCPDFSPVRLMSGFWSPKQ